ncbi:ABC transporter ATP-binding protein [Catellatospora chokoriensis]|uniref:Multidrug ABC transporter permease n=2 Tax=Catellatospora chokoriensis TaxID=310353 RepID=A0A8J3K0F4_9ACTN|nr:multidrug ABC transporter permease [Catellatospora chokoriensis]
MLPELRPMWWESGMGARAAASLGTVAIQLPRLIATALAIAWRADRTRTLTVGLATVVAGVSAAFGLLATQKVLIGLLAAGPTPQRVTSALPALIMVAAAAAVRAGVGIVIGYAQSGLAPRIEAEVHRRLLETTSLVELAAFDEDAFADDMERASRGTNAAVFLVDGAFALIAGLTGLLSVAVAVIVIHPLLLLALLVATAPTAFASLRAGQQRYRTYLAGSVRRRRLNLIHQLMADRKPAPELRTYGLREFLLGQFDRVMTAETRIQLDLARQVTTTTTIGSVTSGIATGAVYALLAWLLLQNSLPLSAAATAVIALQAASRSLATVTFQVDRLYTEGRHFNDYAEFMTRAAAEIPDTTGASNAGPLQELQLHAVTLSYPDRDTPAVDHVTLTIRAGQTVAFVGENGSGKTTLAALIAALRTPSSGHITWNGTRLTDLDPAAFRNRIAVVSQDFHKWPFTAATNIGMGDTVNLPDRDRIEAAARLAVAHDMIEELPHGYATLLDRTFADGQDLSGGQWQRITAARGFLRHSDLLIMDEPSSALDPRAEDALFQAIRDRQGHATTILITHRLANVRHADVIYVLDHGRLVEAGSHDELIAAAGRYAELFTMQARGYGEQQK